MTKNNNIILRGIIGFVLGCIFIAAAMKVAGFLFGSKAKPKVKIENQINKVYTQSVTNAEIPVTIIEKGSLQALKKVELYSEVQGILQNGTKLFKSGQKYKEGSTIFSIDDREFKSNLVAQKSILYNQITQIMPDLKLDYPEVYTKWESYLNNFDIKQSTTPQLPEFSSDKEKYFINNKNIVTTFYNIKNLEERHKKYKIYAPFYGVVTESLVNPGALVRPGQKLGTILSPSVYELPISVNESYKKFIKIGKQVKLHNLNRTQSWNGKIARIDGTINTSTQGIQIFVQLSGKDLKEGMFLEAEVNANAITEGFEISRKLLIENSKTYAVKNDKLKLIDLDIAFFKEKTAIVTNLPTGTILIKNPIPGAYEGMLVEEAKTSN